MAKAEPSVIDADKTPLGPEGGFELIWKDRYLFWIAMLIILLNVVNTTGGYILNKLISAEAVSRFGSAPANWRRADSSSRRFPDRSSPR